MKVSNGQVWQAREPMSVVVKEPWPVKVAYRLAKLARRLNERVATVEAVRVRLVHTYGEENGKGQTAVTPDCPKFEVFMAAVNELMAEEDDFPGEPVLLPTDTDIVLKPEILLPLLPFVGVEGEE